MISTYKLGPRKQAHSKPATKTSPRQAAGKLGDKRGASNGKLPVSTASLRLCAGTAKEWQGGKSQLAEMLKTVEKANILKFTSTDDNKAACGMAPNFA